MYRKAYCCKTIETEKFFRHTRMVLCEKPRDHKGVHRATWVSCDGEVQLIITWRD